MSYSNILNKPSYGPKMTMEQYIISLFEHGKMKTQEFQIALSAFGRSRIEFIYKQWKKNRTNPFDVEDEDGYKFLSPLQLSKIPKERILEMSEPFPMGARYVKLKKEEAKIA